MKKYCFLFLLNVTCFMAFGQEKDVEDKSAFSYKGFNFNYKGHIGAHYIMTFEEGESQKSSIQNGLLPAFFVLDANKNLKNDWELDFTLGVWLGLNSGATDENSAVDYRQIKFTLSKPTFGSLTVGRDFSVFAKDAIFNDISLLSVGAGFSPESPTLTTLGGIGYGYYYLDRFMQLTYQTPKFGNFDATIMLYQAANSAFTDAVHNPNRPGVQARLAYTTPKLLVSSSFINQGTILGDGREISPTGIDLYSRYQLNKNIKIAGYYSYAKGLEDVLLGTLVPNTYKNEVHMFYAQAEYNWKNNKIGFNLGQAKDNDADVLNTRFTAIYEKQLFEGIIFEVGGTIVGGKIEDVDKNNIINVNTGLSFSF